MKENNVLKKELVYFLLHSESNRKSYVKIGKSDSETGVVARVKGCQTGNPIKLILLGYIEGYESEWQSHFRDEWIRGEWFDYRQSSHIISQLNLRIPKNILEDFKKEKISKLNKKIIELRDKIEEDRERFSYDEGNLKEYCEEELEQIGKHNDEIARIDSLEGTKLKEAYTSWAIGHTEEGWYAFERSSEINRSHRKEALKHMRHIEKIINFIHKGTSDKWYGGEEIRYVEAKGSFIDFFNGVVNPGEYYIMVGEYQNGYSLESGYSVYKMFINFMNSRRGKVKSKILGKTDDKQVAKYKKHLDSEKVKYKEDCPIDISKKIEASSLKDIIDDFKNDIDKELGVLYFDDNLCEWRNKETEKNLDNYLKQKQLIEKVTLKKEK
jgi:hypothetical protein